MPHYKSDGSLDMRYSCSRAAVASGGRSYASYGGGGSRRSSSSSSSGMHYKKDGSLDMRYASSRASSSSPYSSPFAAPPAPAPPRASTDVHYKKDGSLDMRYSSSRSMASAASASAPFDVQYAPLPAPPPPVSAQASGMHYKKDGSLDMRYASSQVYAPAAYHESSSHAPRRQGEPLHYKKDGTLDMRYASSQAYAASSQRSSSSRASRADQPLQFKKDGTLDMRYKSSQLIVQQMKQLDMSKPPTGDDTSAKHTRQSKSSGKAKLRVRLGAIPAYVPVTKSGRPDLRTNAAKKWRLLDAHFQVLVELQRHQYAPQVVEPPVLPTTKSLRAVFDQVSAASTGSTATSAVDPLSSLPSTIRAFEFEKDLEIDLEDSTATLGQGSFGAVYRGMCGGATVAIKKLHMSRLAKKERRMFINETLVLGVLGRHPNIVQLFGYTVSPLALVMEYVPRGSLSYLLHYCDDPSVEAKMTDGRVKHNLLLGVAHGMVQLLACGVTHGDIKPQNVLVSTDYQAKIADFGLATLRAKTSSTTSSHMLAGTGLAVGADADSADDDADPEGVACGTAAYMAPELLQPTAFANEKTDVYSFGVLMNELLQEEEPYYQHLRQFVGKGPFAVVLAAKDGLRPVIHDGKVTPELKLLVSACWNPDAKSRPRFTDIADFLAKCKNIPSAC